MKYPGPRRKMLFEAYSQLVTSRTITCASQNRDHNDDLSDFTLVVFIGQGRHVCINPETGLWNTNAFDELQVPSDVMKAALKLLKATMRKREASLVLPLKLRTIIKTTVEDACAMFKVPRRRRRQSTPLEPEHSVSSL